MTCEEILSLLEATVDGEIGPEMREHVTRHLDRCIRCSEEAQALIALAEEARETLGPVEPGRDLWPSIAGRIAGDVADHAVTPIGSPIGRFRHRTRSTRWLAAAAVIGVAVGAALMLPRQTPEEAIASRAEPATSLDVTLASWEREVVQHRAALLASLDRQRDRLPAESIQAVEENLHLIDQAIQEIRSALQQDPDNPKLNFLLADAYQQEVQLLRRLSNV